MPRSTPPIWRSGCDRFLGLIAGLTLGCAEPQTKVAPPPEPPPVESPTHRERCPPQVLGFEEPSSVGLSAAALVAKFGNTRTAPRIQQAATSASSSLELPAEASVSFAHVGGAIHLVGCPPD